MYLGGNWHPVTNLVAISQTENSEDLSEQLANVVSHLRLAVAEGAEFVIFPELSLTGYNTAVPSHLQTSDIVPKIERMIEACHDVCAESSIKALVGTPIFSETYPRPLNAMVLIGDEQRITWTKSEPWRGEVEIFSGHATAIHQGDWSVLICSDWDSKFSELQEKSVVAWPGIMSREWADDPEHEFFRAIAEKELTVYYANWPYAPNPTPKVKEGGQSSLITQNGIEVEAPKSIAGLLKCFDDFAFIPSTEIGT